MARDGDSWLNDYSYIPDRDAFRRARASPKYDVFTGSRPLAVIWLGLIATGAGALGGTLVSEALWSSWLQPPLWLLVTIIIGWATRKAALAVFGQPLGFFTGWCLFWAMLIGAVAMWGAQLSSGGWAYGIAAGFGFIVGITQGVYEHDDLKSRDAWFGVSMLMAPVAACLAAWLNRNGFLGEPSLRAAAMTGAIAALVFMGPAMAFLFATIDNLQGLKRLATLFLHRDETAAEAVPVMDKAVRLRPDDASLYDLRALALALSGRPDAAERDWQRHIEIESKSLLPSVSRGWVALRRGHPETAAGHFEQALGRQKRDTWALVGLGVAFLRQGKPQEALAALELIRQRAHDALSLTHLAEAQLRSGAAQDALDTATDAIDELDSAHGRSFYVRAEAFRALGRIDEAELDYNRAFHAAEEEGLDELAIAGLDAIGRPLDEDEPEY